MVHAVHVNESTLKRVSSGIKTGKRTLRHGEVRTSVDSHMLALQASTCSTVRSSHCAALRSRHRRTFLEQHVTPRKKKAHYFAEDLEIYGKTTIYLLIYPTKPSSDHTLCSHNEVKKITYRANRRTAYRPGSGPFVSVQEKQRSLPGCLHALTRAAMAS